MAIKMNLVRKQLLEAFAIQYTASNYYKLPADFSTHPSHVDVTNVDEHFDHATKEWKLRGKYKVKALSSAEAKALSKTKARSPHRIFIWCETCNRWVFAGKFLQHSKFHGKEKS